MRRWSLILWGLAVALASCAHDVHVRMPGAPEEAATVVLQFTNAVDNAWVSINGVLVAQDAHTQVVVVDGIPPGEATVVVAADGLEKAFGLSLKAGQRVVIPLAVAEASWGGTLLKAFMTVLVYAAYFALGSLF